MLGGSSYRSRASCTPATTHAKRTNFYERYKDAARGKSTNSSIPARAHRAAPARQIDGVAKRVHAAQIRPMIAQGAELIAKAAMRSPDRPATNRSSRARSPTSLGVARLIAPTSRKSGRKRTASCSRQCRRHAHLREGKVQRRGRVARREGPQARRIREAFLQRLGTTCSCSSGSRIDRRRPGRPLRAHAQDGNGRYFASIAGHSCVAGIQGPEAAPSPAGAAGFVPTQE